MSMESVDDPDLFLPEGLDESSEALTGLTEVGGPPGSGFLPKEIQGQVFSAAVQLYVARLSGGNRKIGARDAVLEAAELFSYVANDTSIDGIFSAVTEKLGLDSDAMVDARLLLAQLEAGEEAV